MERRTALAVLAGLSLADCQDSLPKQKAGP